ncbi:unnamed protein product [Rhodiola kirilowii]
MLLRDGKGLFTCISCSKRISNGGSVEEEEEDVETPGRKRVVKALTAQIKEIAVKASGAYKNCKPCVGSSGHKGDSVDAYSEKIHGTYRRTEGSDPISKMWGKEMEARGKGISSGERTPASRRSESMICKGENETKEWVAHVEPGVLITFVSLPEGGNELKKIRFSRDMFNKWQAQRWWTENYEKVIELYNVQRFNRQIDPLQTPQKSEDEVSNVPSVRGDPMTPPLSNERLLHHTHHPRGAEDCSSDCLDQRTMQSCQHDPNGLASTPKVSNISGARTDTSSVQVSARSSSSYETDRSGQLSVSNASDLETEWVEQDEPGVYITICELPNGIRELRRVRFSREKFGEMHARLWWEENRARIQEQYL